MLTTLLTPETVSGLVVVVGGALTAWNSRQAKQIKELRAFRVSATKYIGQLLFAMTSNGITPPDPPDELELVPGRDRADEEGE